MPDDHDFEVNYQYFLVYPNPEHMVAEYAELKPVGDFLIIQHILAQLMKSRDVAKAQSLQFEEERDRIKDLIDTHKDGGYLTLPYPDLLLILHRAEGHVERLGLEMLDLEKQVSSLREKYGAQKEIVVSKNLMRHPFFHDHSNDGNDAQSDPQPSPLPFLSPSFSFEEWCEIRTSEKLSP